MNHHKLKHCEINFWCQLPAWSVWGLWQTSSVFLPTNSYRMKKNCNQIKISIPHCSMNQKSLISLGKVVRTSLGSFGEAAPLSRAWLAQAGTSPHGHLPSQLPGSAHGRRLSLLSDGPTPPPLPSRARKSSATHWAGYGEGPSLPLSAFAYALNKP